MIYQVRNYVVDFNYFVSENEPYRVVPKQVTTASLLSHRRFITCHATITYDEKKFNEIKLAVVTR